MMQLTSGTFVISIIFVSDIWESCILSQSDKSGDSTSGETAAVCCACGGVADKGDLANIPPGVLDPISVIATGNKAGVKLAPMIFVEEDSILIPVLGVYCCTNGVMTPNSQEVTWRKEDTDSTMDSVT